MPLPLAPLLAAGSNLFNTGAQIVMNTQQRNFSREMYDRQRADALTDWNMQNVYNSPAEQMKRLKAAGLNPHLVYGSGGATPTASTPRSSSVESWNPTSPRLDLTSFYDIQLKQAQTDNVKAAIEVAKQDAVYRAAQTASTIASTSQTEFNTQLAKKLETNSLEVASQQLEKLKADTQFTLNNDERQAALTQNTLDKSVEEVLNMRASRANTHEQTQKIRQEIINLKQDSILKQLDINLKRMGFTPGDPPYMRVIAQLLSDTQGVSEAARKLLNKINSGLGDDLFPRGRPGGWQKK